LSSATVERDIGSHIDRIDLDPLKTVFTCTLRFSKVSDDRFLCLRLHLIAADGCKTPDQRKYENERLHRLEV
jgi:hypothetical protein